MAKHIFIQYAKEKPRLLHLNKDGDVLFADLQLIYPEATHLQLELSNYVDTYLPLGNVLRTPEKGWDETLTYMVVVGRVVPSTLTEPETIEQRLKKFDLEFDSRDIASLRNEENFNYFTALMLPNLTKNDAEFILRKVRAHIKSSTRAETEVKHHILLDGRLPIRGGKGTSSFCYAFSNHGRVLAAKIFRKDEEYEREKDMLLKIGNNSNIVEFVKAFKMLRNDTDVTGKVEQGVIVMSFYPMSLEQFISKKNEKVSEPLPLQAISAISNSCALALQHLHSLSICFADLKPSNIMLKTECDGAVLVDFGAAVEFNSKIHEVTRPYYLDVNIEVGSPELDWCCFGTTICRMVALHAEFLERFRSRAKLLLELDTWFSSPLLAATVKACLHNPSTESIASALNLFSQSDLNTSGSSTDE